MSRVTRRGLAAGKYAAALLVRKTRLLTLTSSEVYVLRAPIFRDEKLSARQARFAMAASRLTSNDHSVQLVNGDLDSCEAPPFT